MATNNQKTAAPARKVDLPRPGQIVRVHNREHEGYRRGGVGHKKGTVDHKHDVFEADQLAALMSDPRLDVRVVDAPKDEKGAE